MSGSDMDGNREHFTVRFPQPQPPQHFQLDYSAAVYQTPATNMNGGGDSAAAAPAPAPAPAPSVSSSEPVKRKRGRPRKYGPDVPSLALTSAAAPVSQSGEPFPQSGGPVPQSGEQFPHPLSPATAVSPGSSLKKPRGRPRGSLNKQRSKSSSDGESAEGSGFTSHVITVKAGEDLAAKIMVFSQSVPRNILILSANGSISNATIRQPSSSGGTVTYEGRFEILSLAGSFLLAEDGSQHTRSGALSVTLSGPDGRVLGGAVAGLLIAAAPIQVVLASFNLDGRKRSKSGKQVDNVSGQGRFSSGGQSSSPSRGTLSESSGGL